MTLRNSDSRIRELERRVAQGDQDAEASLLQERMRVGEIAPWRPRLAAALGHQAARRLFHEADVGLDQTGEHQAVLAIRTMIPGRDDQRDAARVVAHAVSMAVLDLVWSRRADEIHLPEDRPAAELPPLIVDECRRLIDARVDTMTSSASADQRHDMLEALYRSLPNYDFGGESALQDAVRVFLWTLAMNRGPGGPHLTDADRERYRRTSVAWTSPLERLLENAGETFATVQALGDADVFGEAMEAMSRLPVTPTDFGSLSGQGSIRLDAGTRQLYFHRGHALVRHALVPPLMEWALTSR